MHSARTLFVVAALTFGLGAIPAAAQQPEPTRQATIEQQQADKSASLQPMQPGKAERVTSRFEGFLESSGTNLHPFFEGAYQGGGFPFGVGYKRFVSPFNTLDVRGSYTIRGYRRIEAEFEAPRLFKRRGSLVLLGGYREATQVPFFGLGIDSSKDNRANFLFKQPYASALLTVMPTRRHWTLRGGVEWMTFTQEPGRGRFPSIETKYTPQTLPGLGADASYLHTQGALAFDWRPEPGYARRGGYYAIRAHDYHDRNDTYGFERVDYEAIQNIPILREAWAISLRAHVSTTFDKSGQEIPFFFLPSVGGGSDLRGYSSYRFRDRNSLLLQAEYRIMVNRFLDTAFFYDAGKVTARTSDLDLDGLRRDFGFGVRFHGPTATALRIDVAKSRESLALVFATSHVF